MLKPWWDKFLEVLTEILTLLQNRGTCFNAWQIQFKKVPETFPQLANRNLVEQDISLHSVDKRKISRRPRMQSVLGTLHTSSNASHCSGLILPLNWYYNVGLQKLHYSWFLPGDTVVGKDYVKGRFTCMLCSWICCICSPSPLPSDVEWSPACSTKTKLH